MDFLEKDLIAKESCDRWGKWQRRFLYI